MSRKNRGQDLTTASDGLSALSVAEHAKDKEDTLRNITDIFTQAMRKKWPGKLYYVDPFCGPGKCLIKTSEEETDGSPIIAAGVPFSRFYFADEDERCIEALRKRLQGMNLSGKQVRY